MPQRHAEWRNLHSVTERVWNRNPDKSQRKSVLFRTVGFLNSYAGSNTVEPSKIPVKNLSTPRRGRNRFSGCGKVHFFAPLA